MCQAGMDGTCFGQEYLKLIKLNSLTNINMSIISLGVGASVVRI